MNKIYEKNDVVNNMFDEISMIINSRKSKMVYEINNILVETNYLIGKIIVENEQNGNIRAEYGKDVLNKLSKKLTQKFGNGYSRSGLQNMRLFYNRYKKCQTLSGNLQTKTKMFNSLSWSHYCYLIYIEDDNERNFYEKECINCKWSVRELKRQINSSLY